MKVAVVKQLLDVSGPCSSVFWEAANPATLLTGWPGEASHWEMTALLKADWYVVPQKFHAGGTDDAVLRHPSYENMLREHTKNVRQPSSIPFVSYDVVISLDPILDIPSDIPTVFGYFVGEHLDRRYSRALRQPERRYDLFLAHMLDGIHAVRQLPQAISFPYLCDPRTMRAMFCSLEREPAIFVDWRTLAYLTVRVQRDCDPAIQAAALRLQSVLHARVCFRQRAKYVNGAGHTPIWNDAAYYLAELSRCIYYASLRATGPGLGVPQAASLGCICFGAKETIYHRLLCHPECLCDDMEEFPERFRRVAGSRDLQGEILEWQDKQLRVNFAERPLQLLEEALELKQRARSG